VPTWSAITGLLGAALGWSRTDERLVRIAEQYAMAVQVVSVGITLEDYHTVQAPDSEAARRGRTNTRFRELLVSEPNTTITRREYVPDGRYKVLVLALDSTPVVSAPELAWSLAHPVYPLYAGRRSCLIGRIAADVVAGDMDTLLPSATHWDARLKTARMPSVVRERHDMRVGARVFAARHECVA
jgi:CRISPR system Cascade subunit CasD